MSEHDEHTSEANAQVDTGRSMTRRRALGLGAAVAGGVWAAPVIMSFDAASATASGGGPTTSTTYVAPPTSSSTSTTSSTTTTTVAQRTITATVTGSSWGLTNPSPVTVNVGDPIVLTFTRNVGPQYLLGLYYSTVNGTAVAGVDYTAKSGSFDVQANDLNPHSITIQTTATGPGANTNFTVNVYGNS